MPPDSSTSAAGADATTPAAPLMELLARIARAVESHADDGEGLDAARAARLIGVSRSLFYDYDRRGLVPAAVTLGTGEKKVWLKSELLAWLSSGAPTRSMWAQQRTAALRRVTR